MTSSSWAIVGILVTAILAFLALGFAAMSTNPLFIVPTFIPYIFFTLAGVSLVSLIVYLIFHFRNAARGIRSVPATRLYDLEMGKHRSTLINVLTTWKKQLHSLSKKHRLKYDDFALEIEEDGYFRFALTHCPSLNKEHATFLIGLGLYQQKFKRLEEIKKNHQPTQQVEKEIKNDRSSFERTIKSQIELIDNSLRSLEYEKHRCHGCPTNMVNKEILPEHPITRPAVITKACAINVKPQVGRRNYPFEHKYLMWVELEITNTSLNQPLVDVEVQVSNLIDVMPVQDQPNTYVLHPVTSFNPTGICWSERFGSPNQLTMQIPSRTTKSALLAFNDNSNGMWTIYNAPLSTDKPRHLGGAKIEITVSSPDSSPWQGVFYIECHPNYLKGPRARFELMNWNEWLTGKTVKQVVK